MADSDLRAGRALAQFLALAAAFTTSWSGVVGLPLGGPTDLLLIAASTALVVGDLRRRVWHGTGAWVWLPVFAACLVMVFDVFVNGAALDWATGNLAFVFRLLIASVMTAYVILAGRAIWGLRFLRMLMLAYLAGVAVNVGIGAATVNGLLDLGDLVISHNVTLRVYGLSAHPNALGSVCALGIPIAMLLLTDRDARRATRIAAAASIPLLVSGLILADSRAAYLAGLGGLLLAIVGVLIRNRLFAVAMPFALVATAASLLWLDPLLANTRFGTTGAAVSDSLRLDEAADALDVLGRSPIFGAGFDSITGVSVPLQLISAGGLVMLLGYYLYFSVAFGKILRGIHSPAAPLALATFLAFVLIQLFQNGLAERSVFWPVLLVAALVEGQRIEAASRSRSSFGYRRDRMLARRGGELLPWAPTR